MFINKVTLYGNLTRDIEIKALPSGAKVANISMATNYSYKGKDGKKVEEVAYHNVVAFGKQAEVLAQYVSKGQSLYIEGRLVTRSWEDSKTGEKRYKTDIMLNEFQFGVNKRNENATQEKDHFENMEPQIDTDENIELIGDDSIDPSSIPF